MGRLKTLLSDSAKTRRYRNTTLNLQITILGWLVEVFGFLTCVAGVFILGHGNDVVTMILHTIAMIIYTIFIPCSVLINSSEAKEYIAESQWYADFISKFGLNPKLCKNANSRNESSSEELAKNIIEYIEDHPNDPRRVIENEINSDPMINERNNRDEDFDSPEKMKNGSNIQDIEVIDLERSSIEEF